MENSITELLHIYQSNRRSMGYSEQTIERVVMNVEMFITDQDINLDNLTTQSILNWGEQKLRTVGHSTLYTYYNSIRSFVSFLNQQGIETSVDTSQIRCRPQYKSRVWLRPAQIKHIIGCANPPAGILIRLMYTSGMRISEALSLTDKHLEDGTTIYIKAKGGNQRPIFLTKELHEQLHTLATLHGGFCFIDSDGEQLSRKKAYYLVKQAMVRAGYPNAYPHALRHSFCTELLRKGVSLSHAQRLMGHANISITQIYEHLLTDDIEKAHLKLTKV